MKSSPPTASETRNGLTLLEVVLALAILGGAVVMLGELMRQGRRSAEAARDLTRAQLLCESKLAELAAGVLPLASVNGAAVEEDPRWLYSVSTEPAQQLGLLVVRVTVVRDLPTEQRPIEFSLVRWLHEKGDGSRFRSTTEAATQ